MRPKAESSATARRGKRAIEAAAPSPGAGPALAWQKLVGAHDFLSVARMLCPGLDGVEDAQTILRALAASFGTNEPHAAEAQRLRERWANEARAALSKKNKAGVTIPFGATLRGPRSKSLHAKMVAFHVDHWPRPPGSGWLPVRWLEFAAAILEALRGLFPTSPIGKHVAARWSDPTKRDLDVGVTSKRLRHDWEARGTLKGERAVLIALRAIGFPRPDNVFGA